jgi:hypothetical protein
MVAVVINVMPNAGFPWVLLGILQVEKRGEEKKEKEREGICKAPPASARLPSVITKKKAKILVFLPHRRKKFLNTYLWSAGG